MDYCQEPGRPSVEDDFECCTENLCYLALHVRWLMCCNDPTTECRAEESRGGDFLQTSKCTYPGPEESPAGLNGRVLGSGVPARQCIATYDSMGTNGRHILHRYGTWTTDRCDLVSCSGTSSEMLATAAHLSLSCSAFLRRVLPLW